MKKNSGITLVSLVVTIIVLIILAGVSINLTIGENGIMTIAKQAKENMELAKVAEETRLNELYMQIEAEGGASGDSSYDAIVKLTEFKKAIADYIEEAGGVKPEYTAERITFGDSIKGIVKEVTKNATATEEDIAEGKTAYVDGKLITGKGSSDKGMPYLEKGKFPVATFTQNSDVYINTTLSNNYDDYSYYYREYICFIPFIQGMGLNYEWHMTSPNTLNVRVSNKYATVPDKQLEFVFMRKADFEEWIAK